MAKQIAFQGEPGAFSHAAAHALFPKGDAVPCVTFEDTIAAVQQGKADYGVVPVENSLYGRITDIYHLLPESGLFITGEHFLRIEMNLLGVKGSTLKDVKSVQSLSVALGQCRKFIRKHKLKTINGIDTAGSAREIAERGDKSAAAIASRRSPTSSSCPGAPASTIARMELASSLRGLSSVTIPTSASSAVTRPISRRLPRSRSPPAPNTTINRPETCGRNAAIAASSASGVWA